MNYQRYILSILKASGWSQEELAQRLGVSFVTLNAWANGRAKPRKKALTAIETLYFDIVGTDEIDVAELAQKKQIITAFKIHARTISGNEKLLNKLTLHLTYHTNTIEGSTMTLSDTEEVLFEHKVLSNRTQIEQAEARNHQAALLWLLDRLQSKKFTIDEDLVVGLHLRLMNGIISDAGQYRKHSVRIMGANVPLANYQKISVLMGELLGTTDQKVNDLVGHLARTHATFEKIHPFSDGNGRVGRLLILAQALQAGIVPPLVLKEKKQAYYKYLELAQTKEQFAPLELFLAESIATAHELLSD